MVAAGILLFSSSSAAQESVEQAREKIARLERRAEELARKADSVTRVERERWADSLARIEEGGFLILAPHDLAADVKESAGLAANLLAATFGDSIARLIQEEPFLVFPERGLDTARTDLRYLEGLGTPVLAPATDRVRGLAVNLMGKVHQRVWNRLDPEIRNWLGAPIAPTLDPERVPGSSYLDLVTASAPPAIACFGGDLPGCIGALGLERPADPGLAWYAPEGRRELVGRLSQVLRVGEAGRQRFDLCINAGRDDLCQDLLRQIAGTVPPPLTPATRETLLRMALRNGGPEALTRLLASPGEPMARRLSQAAATDLISLLGEWRTRVIAARPAPTVLHPREASMALVWVGLLLVLSLRSSRWR
jgi:hypothetical protein